jgi:hypothetical protein
MHHGEFATLDWILLTLFPAVLGSGIGILLGLARGRAARAAVAGLAGGTVGAWAGVIVYCLAVLPRVHDPLIFTGCVFAGIFLGAVPLVFVFAWPRGSRRPPPVKSASSSVGAVLGGILGLLIGMAVAYLSIERGSASGVESLGYVLWPLVGLIIGAPAGLLAVVLPGKRGEA